MQLEAEHQSDQQLVLVKEHTVPVLRVIETLSHEDCPACIICCRGFCLSCAWLSWWSAHQVLHVFKYPPLQEDI